MTRGLNPFPGRSVLLQEEGAHLGTIGRRLFEKVGDGLRNTLVAEVSSPSVIHRAESLSAFTPNDYPVYSREIKISKRFKQRLAGQKLDLSVTRAKRLQPVEASAILDSNAHPNIGSPRTRPHGSTLRTLCQHLESVLGMSGHGPKNLANKVVRDVVNKEIRHGIDKNHRWSFEFFRLSHTLRAKSDIGRRIFPSPRESGPTKLVRNSFRVAIQTPGTDFCASSGRVPRLICPPDNCWHDIPLSKSYATIALSSIYRKENRAQVEYSVD